MAREEREKRKKFIRMQIIVFSYHSYDLPLKHTHTYCTYRHTLHRERVMNGHMMKYLLM